MRLMTKGLEKRFAEIGPQREVDDPIIVAEFYTLDDSGLWYATEYDPKTQIFFGYVVCSRDTYDQWDHFSLEQLEYFRGSYGAGVQRRMYRRERRVSAFGITR